MEMSLDEYSDLLVEISKLSEDDALLELLEAARFGETDVVRALVASFPVLLNKAMDDSGVTPLHKAAANGHISTVHALIDAKSPFLKNKSGNTPLHWAASNGHAQVVALLLEHFSDIDVLDRNEFGRSSLTEGFGSKSTETAKLLLAHSSASEEKLLMGAVETDDQAQENEDDTMAHAKLRKSKGSIIHDFSFGMETDKTCRIRELAISEDPFGSSPMEDTTGLGVWCASLVMARWMVDMASRFDGKTTIELGAGCGVPGLTLATHATLEHLWVTDLNPETVANLQFNVELNNLCQSTTACTIDWDDTVTWPETMVDTIIGSDLIYVDCFSGSSTMDIYCSIAEKGRQWALKTRWLVFLRCSRYRS